MTAAVLPGEALGRKVRAIASAVLYWVLRPVRAIVIAYGYVLSGEKVTTPHNWKDI